MDLGKKILGQKAFHQLMKMTFYGQFVAGEDHIAIRPLIQKNQAFGVGSVLDYGVEEDLGTEAEQKEMEYESCGILCLHCQSFCFWVYIVRLSSIIETLTVVIKIIRNLLGLRINIKFKIGLRT